MMNWIQFTMQLFSALTLIQFLILVCDANSSEKEFVRISSLLQKKGSSSGSESLAAIKSNEESLSEAAKAIIKMEDQNSGCSSRVTIDHLYKYLERHRKDEKMAQLSKYVSEIYLRKCWSEYFEEGLRGIVQKLKDEGRDQLWKLIDHKFIRDYHIIKPDLADRIHAKSQPGSLTYSSRGLVVDYVERTLKVSLLAPRTPLLIKAAEKFSELLINSCPAYFKNAKEIIQELRQLTSLIGGKDSIKSVGFSEEFAENFFRFSYCEDIFLIGIPRFTSVESFIRKKAKEFFGVETSSRTSCCSWITAPIRYYEEDN